jgi:hypothetical protein
MQTGSGKTLAFNRTIDKLKFDEEISKKIIKRFNLNETVSRVWKIRNAIPDMYFTDNFSPKKRIHENAQLVIAKRIIDIFTLKELNTSTLMQLADIKNFHDIKANRSSFTPDNILNAKKEINRLKIDIKKTFATKSFKQVENLLLDKRIKKYVIFPPVPAVPAVETILKSGIITNKHYEQIKDAFILLALKLSI